jgi:lipid II isoglutaminyl synthase (glutamine-hydrolysing)
VTTGVGNGDGTDGAVDGRVVATYLHGPVLARNPALADLLLGLALGRGAMAGLAPGPAEELHDERLAAGRRGR